MDQILHDHRFCIATVGVCILIVALLLWLFRNVTDHWYKKAKAFEQQLKEQEEK